MTGQIILYLIGRIKEIDCESLNVISTISLVTFTFSATFLDGQGDSLSNGNLVEILKIDSDSFTQKMKHIIILVEQM